MRWPHRQWWVALNSSYLNPLDYQVWRQCWALWRAATEAKISSWV